MKIYESAEDYLETILLLKNQIGLVRSIDIVNHLGYSKPSVSVAMKKLRENELITVNDSGHIELTEQGQKIASGVYEKHQILTTILIDLGVTPEIAKEDACKIEHHLSDESFEKIRDYINRKK